MAHRCELHSARVLCFMCKSGENFLETIRYFSKDSKDVFCLFPLQRHYPLFFTSIVGESRKGRDL